MSEKKDEMILLTQDSCSNCQDAKKLLRSKINSGQVKILDADSPRGKELVKKYKIEEVPYVLMKGEQDKKYSVCELSSDGKSVFCATKNGEKEIKI